MTSLLTLLIAIAVTMIVVNYILSDADSIMQGVTLGVFSIMYLILVILMTRSFLNEVYLIIFSYIVLASFFGIEVSLSLIFESYEWGKLLFEGYLKVVSLSFILHA